MEYDKLDYMVFPTIRRRDKYGDVGDTNEVIAGPRGERRTLGRAEIIAKDTVTMASLNNQLFMFDTDTTHYDDAVNLINSFYSDDVENGEELTLYWNRWVDRENQTLTAFNGDSE